MPNLDSPSGGLLESSKIGSKQDDNPREGQLEIATSALTTTGSAICINGVSIAKNICAANLLLNKQKEEKMKKILSGYALYSSKGSDNGNNVGKLPSFCREQLSPPTSLLF